MWYIQILINWNNLGHNYQMDGCQKYYAKLNFFQSDTDIMLPLKLFKLSQE